MKIGFFDTGLGGATIFKESYKKIAAEYIYLADTKNSPYGIKDVETVKNLTENCVKKLIDLDCKIIVLACNTATSAAVAYLRAKYTDVIFIGAEPAIKPALKKCTDKKIILTATSLTLKGSKLFTLLTELNAVDKVALLALDELVKFADESNEIQYNSAYEYLKRKFSNYNLNDFSGIVLGCTHFPIFKDVFRKLLPDNIEIYDSATGITTNLKRNILKLCPDYSCKDKKVDLILTEENKSFKEKFYGMIEE